VFNERFILRQKELSSELQLSGINKSQSTISRILKKMNYTRKRLLRVPEERNNERNIETRQNYARRIEYLNDDNLVFLDETGISYTRLDTMDILQ
jgi:arginine repressor